MGVVVLLSSVTPFPAHAQGLPVGDILTEVEGAVDDVSNVMAAINSVEQELKAFGLDQLAYNLAQALSQKLVSKALNAINGGASSDNNPNFVTNFGQYFQNITNQQTSKFLGALTNDTANPFAQGTGVAITNSVAAGAGQIDNFTLNKIPGLDGDNWKAASTNISAAGSNGWDFYSALAEPQNTPIGTAMLAQDQLANNVDTAQNTAKTQLGSSGFLPSTKSNDSSSTSSSSSDSASSSDSEYADDTSDAEITNPTQTNEDVTSQAVSEPYARLRNVTSLGQLVFNSIQQIAQGLITKGISSLQSDLSKPQQHYGSPLDQASASGTITTTTANGVTTTTTNPNTSGWASGPQIIIDLRNQLVPAIQSTKADISTIQDRITVLKQAAIGNILKTNQGANVTLATCTPGTAGCISKPIMSLETCVPGPDTGWDARLKSYIADQTSPTQAAGTNNGDANSVAVQIINQQTKLAIQEETQSVNNPLLNIPGAARMSQALQAYYQNGQNISKTFDILILREQALSALKAVESQILSSTGPTSSNPNAQPLILFDDQWQAMATSDQQSEYNSLKAKILASFPQYADPTNSNTLSALAPDDPTVSGVNQDMEKRVLDEQWLEWNTRTDITSTTRQSIYAQFQATARNTVDPTTLAGDVAQTQTVKSEVADIIDTLHDCIILKAALASNPPATLVGNTSYVNGLGLVSKDLKEAVLINPSILDAINNPTQNPVDWGALNQISIPPSQPVDTETSSFSSLNGFYPEISGITLDLMGLNGVPNDGTYGTKTLQVTLPITTQTTGGAAVTRILNQDSQENLFCRLSNYVLIYWLPDGVTGSPIGCGKPPGGGPGLLVGIRHSGGTNAIPIVYKVKRYANAQWYHTSPINILFNTTGTNN